MNWIDDRIKQRENEQHRLHLISASAEQIFNDLWSAITPWVEDAKTKDIPLFTNGTPYERVISLSVPPLRGQSSANPKQLTIKLIKESAGAEIRVHGVAGTGGFLRLKLDVCDDGVVCLEQDGKPIAISDIAIRILDRFLFPDLPSENL